MSRTLAALLALMAALLVAGCASGSLPGVGVSTEPPAGVASIAFKHRFTTT